MKTCFLGKKAYAESLPPLSCANFVKRTASRAHPMHNFTKFVICKVQSIPYEKSGRHFHVYIVGIIILFDDNQLGHGSQFG